MFGTPTETTTTAATGDNNIDGVLSGLQWESTSVTYSFTDSFTTDYESGYLDSSVHSSTFQTLNATQQNVARSWMKNFSDVSGLLLTELTGAADKDATIRMAMSDDAEPTAYAYYPYDGYVESGDAFFNRNDYNSPGMGNYAYHTFGHELGHSLGLKHGQEGGGVRNISMNTDRDSMEFSIMTYRAYISAPLTGYPNETWGFAQSLMMYDIRATQQMYGANFNTNSTDTTYTFSLTTGEMSLNGVGQGAPGANRIFRTVWDGNGIDTYDFSNYTTKLSIDLTPGGWSNLSVGGNVQRANLGNGNYARGHVFNALQYNGDARSLIENANGGSNDDLIVGNSANNKLMGYGGNDTIKGGGGQDNMDGGIGTDTVDFSDWTGGGSYNLETGRASFKGVGEQMLNFENIITGNGKDLVTGSAANNRIETGAGDDTIIGGAGIDTMIGGIGNDIYYVDNVDDIVTETSTIPTEIDIIYASVSYTLGENIENLKLNGSNTIDGFGNSLDNTITGNRLANTLNGNAGDDILTGGGGIDSLTGGLGADIFQFNYTTDGIDTITDFASDDEIGIFAVGFKGGLVAGALNVNQFLVSSSGASDSNQRFIYNSSNGGLFFDIDGSGASASVQFATLSSNPTLSAANFVII